MIIETDLAPDVKGLARALSDRAGLAVLASRASSFVACDPVEETDELVPQGSESHGWAGLPAAPRWIGRIPYEALRGLERAGWSRPETRPEPMVSTTKWQRYEAVLRIDPTGMVVAEADSVDAALRLISLARREPAPERPFRLVPLPDEDDESAHEARIVRALELIAAGDVYQVNLARRLVFSLEGHPIDLWASMWRRAPAEFGVFLDMQDVHVCGTSPELALSVRGSRLATAPIKGTRPRGDDWISDHKLAVDLDVDPKERAELVMAIDLHRNDLGRVAKPGSVRLVGEPAVSTGTTVHSRSAQVVAERAVGSSLSGIARAFLPAGSVTGAPKVRALEIIAELEAHRRGLYTGAVGYVGRDGSLVLAMAIRTATVASGVVHYFAGGGIVWGSDPRREVLETRWKATQITQP